MEFNQLFIWIIYVLVTFLIILIIKVARDIIDEKRLNSHTISILEIYIEKENLKFKRNSDQLWLADSFYKSLIDRLFKITTDIILLQKHIFEMRIN